MGRSLNYVASLFKSPIIECGTLIKRTPKGDPNLENCPYDVEPHVSDHDALPIVCVVPLLPTHLSGQDPRKQLPQTGTTIETAGDSKNSMTPEP